MNVYFCLSNIRTHKDCNSIRHNKQNIQPTKQKRNRENNVLSRHFVAGSVRLESVIFAGGICMCIICGLMQDRVIYSIGQRQRAKYSSWRILCSSIRIGYVYSYTQSVCCLSIANGTFFSERTTLTIETHLLCTNTIAVDSVRLPEFSFQS